MNQQSHLFLANSTLGKGLIIIAVLAITALLAQVASPLLLALVVASAGAFVLLRFPIWGLVGLIFAALLFPFEFGTGTDVMLNATTLIIPGLLGIWFVRLFLSKNWQITRSRTYVPLLLFLFAALISLLIGWATWDPTVPRSGQFFLVQIAQWAIFAFSAGAFLLAANLPRDERWLKYLTFLFLIAAGVPAILQQVPALTPIIRQLTTVAFIRAPFWSLLVAMALGQLLFNKKLSLLWKVYLLLVLAATAVYILVEQQEAASNWIGVGVVIVVMGWLRWPRLRWLALFIVLIMAFSGTAFTLLWDFAGGDEEWFLSGGSRLALTQRVVEDTLRNPITGLGPAAYRAYGATRPLIYEHIVWYAPRISSHNNYIDLFAHVGLLGLSLFFWFVYEVERLGAKLKGHYQDGFAAGYVNGVLAAGSSALVLMALADWILPYVYNIGFPGFQASVFVWLFLGGLVALTRFSTETI